MAKNEGRTVTYGDTFEAAGVRWLVLDARTLDMAGGGAAHHKFAVCWPADAEGVRLPYDAAVKIGRAVRSAVRISVHSDGYAFPTNEYGREDLTGAQRDALAADLPSFDVPALTAAEVAERAGEAVLSRVPNAAYGAVGDALPGWGDKEAHMAVAAALTPDVRAGIVDRAVAAFRQELSERLAAY